MFQPNILLICSFTDLCLSLHAEVANKILPQSILKVIQYHRFILFNLYKNYKQILTWSEILNAVYIFIVGLWYFTDIWFEPLYLVTLIQSWSLHQRWLLTFHWFLFSLSKPKKPWQDQFSPSHILIYVSHSWAVPFVMDTSLLYLIIYIYIYWLIKHLIADFFIIIIIRRTREKTFAHWSLWVPIISTCFYLVTTLIFSKFVLFYLKQRAPNYLILLMKEDRGKWPIC